MAIVNRDKSASEQVQDVVFSSNVVLGTAATFLIATIPYPSQLVNAGAAYFGLSGSPSHSLWVLRFAGGLTSIQVGASLAVQTFGTSGYQGFSILPAATSFPLQTGDQVMLQTVGANTAVAAATITLAVQALQDIKQHFTGPA